MNVIHKIHQILNEVKGFIAGYSSNKPNKMVIKYNDEFYAIKVEKLEPPTDITPGFVKRYNIGEKTSSEDYEHAQMLYLLNWEV